jgi:hypothetical protein
MVMKSKNSVILAYVQWTSLLVESDSDLRLPPVSSMNSEAPSTGESSVAHQSQQRHARLHDIYANLPNPLYIQRSIFCGR